MTDKLTLNVMGKTMEVESGITLQELSKKFRDQFSYPIVLAKIDDNYRELHHTVTHDCKIEFFDLTSRIGNRIYIHGLVYVSLLAVKELFGKAKDLRVQHSLDKGLYIETSFPLNETKLGQIKEKMQEIIKEDMPITRVNVERKDAMTYFGKMNDLSKVGVMNYNTNTTVTLYRLGYLYNYFYNYMVPSTGTLTHFDVTYLNDRGFVLQFPTVYHYGSIEPYRHHKKMYEVYQECRDWAKIMHLENASDLNLVVSEGRIGDLIRMDETLQSHKLLSVAKQIFEKKNTIKLILLSGPSSSGKTTTCRKLKMYLKSFGLNPKMLSMDNYFVDRDKTPLDEEGKPDYERLDAIDLTLFNDQISSLLKGEEVLLPHYNFLLGTKEFKENMKLEKNDILMIEGLHALNGAILKDIPRNQKFKLYVSALTELNVDNHNRISTTDNRLLRRIIRDNRTRGYGVEKTLESWPMVRRGEEKYVFPYQDEADYIFNSALIYEIGVLKTYVEPLLYAVPNSSSNYEEAKRLINFLRMFLPIPSEDIPKDSILREFIGGSCFHS